MGANAEQMRARWTDPVFRARVAAGKRSRLSPNPQTNKAGEFYIAGEVGALRSEPSEWEQMLKRLGATEANALDFPEVRGFIHAKRYSHFVPEDLILALKRREKLRRAGGNKRLLLEGDV